MKKLTKLFQDPHFLRVFHGYATIFWIVMIPISVFTGWVNLTVYVSALSLWALVASHWAAWQASRIEDNDNETTSESSSRK